MNRRIEKIVLFILLLLFTIGSSIFVFLGKIWTDENWYYSGAVLVSQGFHPFHDFISHHNPVYYYVYALPQYLFGPSLMVGRFTSFLITICISILTFMIAKRLGNRYSGLFALTFLVYNHYATGFYNMMTYHPLESLLILLFFFVIMSKIKDHFKYTICTTLLILTIGVRYPIDISLVYLVLFLLYVFIKSKSLSSFFIQLAIAIILIAALYTPILSVYQKWFYQTIEYPIFGTTTGKLDLMGDPSLLSLISARLYSIDGLIRNFLPVIVVILSICLGTVIAFFTNRKELYKEISEKGILYSMLGFVVITEMFYQIPIGNSAVSRIFYFPVACIIAGVLWDSLIPIIKEKHLRRAIVALPIVLIIVSIPVQNKPLLRKSWETAHLNYLNQVSDYLESNTPENAEIFTFQPPFVIEADRMLSMNMLMEVWQIMPKMTTDDCEKYGMVNIDMIIEELNEKKPYALLLKNPGRLDDNNGKGRLLIPYRDTIWKAINENYYLAHSIPMKKGADPVINIYYQKPK